MGAAPATSGAGGEGGGAVQARVDLATYCRTIGETYSEWLTFCYGSDAYPESEAAEFAANIESSCLLAEPAVEAGRVAFDEVTAASCLATIDTMSCDGFTFVEGREECQGVMTGLVAVGEPCYSGAPNFAVASSECEDGYCDMSGQTCPGACVALKADDEACSSSSECQPESYCFEEVCTVRPAVGEACSGDACPYGVSCVTAPNETEGVCVARSVAGQACDESAPCSFGFQCLGGECQSKVATGEPCAHPWNCADGERCLERDGEGLTCGEPGGVDVPCAGHADCSADLHCGFMEPRSCQPRAALGSTCTRDEECVSGAWCNIETGECQAPVADGDSCLTNGFPTGSPHACETGLMCMDDGLCHPVGADGAPCRTTNGASCEEGLYCNLGEAICEPLAAQGQPCNPWLPTTCEGDLTCLCDDADCSLYSFMLPHTCGPRRAEGDPCFATAECPVNSACLGTEQGECTAPAVPCRFE